MGESLELGIVAYHYRGIWRLVSGVWLELNNAAANADGHRLRPVAGA